MEDPIKDPIDIQGTEASQLHPELADGGLLPVYGVQSFQVFRACRPRPDLADGRGWTYNHHMDMACWRGRLCVAWESGEKDEDIWPAHELYSTSSDGMHWTAPQELFPQEVATPLRMYFFHAPNGRMLALAGARIDHAKTTEKRKGPLVVREIHADYSLGPIYTLSTIGLPRDDVQPRPDLYTRATDLGFVLACEQLLANHTFLEQQDYGNLLGSQGMKWHDPASWPVGKYTSEEADYFGKAMSFYHRKDGKIVGIAKKGWVTVSADEGNTWSEPVAPHSLVTGTAKVWGQRTSDGRYVLVYNPQRKDYYPLVAVTGEDGIHYREMRVVYGEAPIMRYEGRAKERGPRYIRGISEWANDGSRHDSALWLVYSVNEEDVWVSRIPVPIHTTLDDRVHDDFRGIPVGSLVPHWNTYSPQWATVTIEEMPGRQPHCLRLEDRDPYDYASATRMFAPAQNLQVSFAVAPGQSDCGLLNIDLSGGRADACPVRLSFAADGKIHVENGGRDVALSRYRANQWLTVQLRVDTRQHHFTVALNGTPILQNAAFSHAAETLQRITFRTGEYRGSFREEHAAPGSDQPSRTVFYRIRAVQVSPVAHLAQSSSTAKG